MKKVTVDIGGDPVKIEGAIGENLSSVQTRGTGKYNGSLFHFQRSLSSLPHLSIREVICMKETLPREAS